MYDYNCGKCGGLVPEPMKAYGYAGRYCSCESPTPPLGNISYTDTTGTAYIQICTCGQKCPIHETNPHQL